MSEIAPTSMPPRTATDILSSIDKQVKDLSGGNNEKVKDIYKKVAEIISGEGVRVSRGGTTGVDGNPDTSKTNGATGAPSLDNPDDQKAKEADLAKLIAYLQLDNEERQTEMAKDRIDLQKSSLDVEHKGRMKEIEDSIKKMKDAEKASLASRIFGWIGAVFAVAAAVVLTITTGGAAAGFAIAGAVLAVSSLIMNETGAMEAITEKLVEHLKDQYGMTSANAQLAATLIVNLTMIALSAACGIGALAAASAAVASATANTVAAGTKLAATTAEASSKTMSAAAKIATMVVSIANTAVGAGSIAAGGASTYYNKVSEDKKADVTEIEKFITMLQQRLDESQEELEILLQQIEAALGDIAELVSSATDTSNEIARKIGEMA